MFSEWSERYEFASAHDTVHLLIKHTISVFPRSPGYTTTSSKKPPALKNVCVCVAIEIIWYDFSADSESIYCEAHKSEGWNDFIPVSITVKSCPAAYLFLLTLVLCLAMFTLWEKSGKEWRENKKKYSAKIHKNGLVNMICRFLLRYSQQKILCQLFPIVAFSRTEQSHFVFANSGVVSKNRDETKSQYSSEFNFSFLVGVGVSVSFVRSFCLLNNFLLVGTRSVVHYNVNHSYVLQACKGFQRIQLCLQSNENNQQWNIIIDTFNSSWAENRETINAMNNNWNSWNLIAMKCFNSSLTEAWFLKSTKFKSSYPRHILNS